MRNEVLDVQYPEFPGQREDEQVIMVLYKHWYIIFFAIAKSLLIILLSFVVPIWLGFADFIFSFPISAFLYYAWHVFWVGTILYDYINWLKGQYIITNQRVINIDQKGLFKRRVSEIELDKIQHITHSIEGLPATILNFGTVNLQSASTHTVVLTDVATPSDIQEDITKLVKDINKNHRVDPDLINLIKDDDLI